MLRWIGSATVGTDPRYFGYGPVPATEKLLRRFDLQIDDIGLVELNEAFAAQAIGCMRQLVSITTTPTLMAEPSPGPPYWLLGAPSVTLMHEMKRRPVVPRPL